MTVLLAGPPDAPRVLDRRRIELSDPSDAQTAQPFHASFGTEQTDPSVVARLTKIVERCANESVAGLVRAYHAMDHRPERIGIVVGSIIDPASIANQHIRAHAQEGRLFRTVVEAAAIRHGMTPAVFPERDLYAVAARSLGGTPQRLQRTATDLGRAVGRPWRAEEKVATVAAWLALAARHFR